MEHWFTFPQIDPVAFSIGPVDFRWYALSYILGILGAVWYAKRICSVERLWKDGQPAYKALQIDDFLLWATLGIILGGRLGYVLFYDPAHFAKNPSEILMLWQGGMSFHGGMLGVLAAVFAFSYVTKNSWISLLDLACASAPIGLFTGRLANFVNGELFGRVTSHPIGMFFPNGGPLPRHPSQLYEAALEGALVFSVIAVLIWAFRALHKPGLCIGVFGIGYGLSRIIVEFFREPDAHIGFLFGSLTMGILLSIPMVLVGCLFVFRAFRKAK